MKLLNTRSFIFFGLAALSGVVLLHTSQNVQHAEGRVAELEKSINMEQERIRMLKAEWAHLNRPERLEKLAQEFLDLAPPPTKEMPEHLMTDYPEYPPEIEEAPAVVIPREIEVQPVSAMPKKAKAIPMKVKEEPVKKPVTQEVKRDFSSVLEGLKEGAP
jgi:cell division protein FtsL